MRIDIMTLFPDAVNAMMDSSIIGRAQERGYIAIRTHQIRAHLASTGHPLLGDTKYGDPKLNRKMQSEFSLHHQLLHAGMVCFPEGEEGALAKVSGRTFTAPLPGKFAMILQALNLIPDTAC